METLAPFMTQFLWFLVVWPWSLRLTTDMRLRFWIAPQMFRALGLGLLVPQLSPGLSNTFAFPTAAVDFFTAILALLAFVGPFMIVAHVACLAALLGSRTQSRNKE